MINFLFLDADDTLLDFSWAEDQAIHRTYRELGAEMTDEMYARYHVVNQGYWQTYERGEITREEAIAKIQQESRRYAKRQLTWFRKNPDIHWLLLDREPDFSAIVEEACRLAEDS